MKKKSASKSAFFNLRVLIGLFIVLAGVFLALAGFGTFSAIAANSLKAQQKHKIVNIQGLPPGFDCATIHEKGIDKMESMRAGLIMIACGEAEGGSPAPGNALVKLARKLLPVPLAYGAADVDLVTGTETFPHTTQSETFSTANPDNPDEICVAFNDSRGAEGAEQLSEHEYGGESTGNAPLLRNGRNWTWDWTSTLSARMTFDLRAGLTYNWDFGATISHEIVPRVLATVGYFRRLYGNFIVTDNLAVAPSDYSPFDLTVPTNARLPTSGTVITAFDVTPTKFGISNNFVSPASDYGSQTEHWNGVEDLITR